VIAAEVERFVYLDSFFCYDFIVFYYHYVTVYVFDVGDIIDVDIVGFENGIRKFTENKFPHSRAYQGIILEPDGGIRAGLIGVVSKGFSVFIFCSEICIDV
jgi:hypothetical protein